MSDHGVQSVQQPGPPPIVRTTTATLTAQMAAVARVGYLGGTATAWRPGDKPTPAASTTPKTPPLRDEQRRVYGEMVHDLARRTADEPDDDERVPVSLAMGSPVREQTPSRTGEGDRRQLVRTPLATVSTRRQQWLRNGRIPLGVVTVLAGRGGEGKSTWAAGVCAQTTRGLLDGDVRVPVDVLIVGHEDDAATVLKPRLIAAGADVDRVSLVQVRTQPDQAHAAIPVLPLDMPRIREAIEETGARLVVIDPLSSLIEGSLDRVRDVRAALDPLAALAADSQVAILSLLHFRKGAGHVSDLLSGSHAFRDTARSVLLVATDPETGNRVVSVDKSNYSPDRESFAFRLEGAEVRTDDGGVASVARAVEVGVSLVSVADLVQREQDAGSLGAKSAALLAVVNRHPEGISIEHAAAEAGQEVATARRYLARLEAGDKVMRLLRGIYGPIERTNGTPRGGAVPSVSNVPSGQKETHRTQESTPARGVPLGSETPYLTGTGTPEAQA